jgi:hypothetical protein
LANEQTTQFNITDEIKVWWMWPTVVTEPHLVRWREGGGREVVNVSAVLRPHHEFLAAGD